MCTEVHNFHKTLGIWKIQFLHDGVQGVKIHTNFELLYNILSGTKLHITKYMTL
jgi:hypothetical protein